MSVRPGHDGDPRIPVLINLPGLFDGHFGSQVSGTPIDCVAIWFNSLADVVQSLAAGGDYLAPCGSVCRCVKGDISAVMGEDHPGDPGELVG
jgi:hypothetical protein